jgi:hypothetical protein
MQGYEWADDAVNVLTQNNVLNGVDGNNFAPQESVTYEQLAKMVAAAFNLSQQSESLPPDVEADRWSAPYILSSMKYFTKNQDGKFTPESFVKRHEVTSVITQAAFEAKGM